MNVLALSAQIPYPPHHGKAMRDYHLLTGLAQKHNVQLLCMAGDPGEMDAAIPLAERVAIAGVPLPAHTVPRRLGALLLSRQPDLVWRTASPCFRELLAGRLLAERPDVLLVEGLEMATYGLAAPGIVSASSGATGLAGRPGRCRVPAVVLDEHNAEYLLQQRAWEIGRLGWRSCLVALYSRVQAGRLARFEACACTAADRVVAVSPADRQALLRIAPEAQIAVVPNGVDTVRYAPLEGERGTGAPRLVFTGRMDFRPNIDAAQWFCAEIWPRIRLRLPEARFQVVGRRPTPAVQALGREPGVEVVGEVPDDRPYIGRADLYVLPMRFGGGIRFKLLQALSMERAVLSTSLGAEGVEGLVDGAHLMLAESAEDFGQLALELLQRPEVRERLGRAGRELVVTRYDWKVIVPRFESVLLEAAGKEA